MIGQPPLLKFRTMGEDTTMTLQNTRRTGPLKIGTRPKKIGRTLLTKHQFRSRAYDIPRFTQCFTPIILFILIHPPYI